MRLSLHIAINVLVRLLEAPKSTSHVLIRLCPDNPSISGKIKAVIGLRSMAKRDFEPLANLDPSTGCKYTSHLLETLCCVETEISKHCFKEERTFSISAKHMETQLFKPN